MDKVLMAEKLCSILRKHATNQQTASMIAEIMPVIDGVVAEEREACGWKPIETAPKDNTEIDIWVLDGYRVPNCRWVMGSWKEFGTNGFEAQDWMDLESPATHWRHTPAAPKDKVSE